ncbi:MAG TPA: hypothetical protein VJN48_08220 [Terriglobales bacterium]|nr:hypothetical protein [Terriglobales bacterium]
MSDAQRESEKQQVWKLLSEAGLVDIGPDEFPKRIKEAKDVVLKRLTELLEATPPLDECQSAAYSLGALTQLETKLGVSAKPIRSDK